MQIQHRAVPLQHTDRQLFDWHRHVHSILQPITGQARTVMLPRLVEPPVFQNPQPRVVVTLHAGVDVRRAHRRHFQHEVRRLPLLRNDVPVAGFVGRRVDVEGNQQVRIARQLSESARLCDDPAVGLHQGGLGIAQVNRQGVGTSGLEQVVELGHFVGLAFRDVGQTEAARGRGGKGGGFPSMRSHGAPGEMAGCGPHYNSRPFPA